MPLVRNSSRPKGNRGRQRAPKQTFKMKARIKCTRWRKAGHWKEKHKEDGSMKPGALWLDDLTESDSQNRALTFNMALLDHDSCSRRKLNTQFGSKLDDGALYNGIGATELSTNSDMLWPEFNRDIEAINWAVAYRPYLQCGTGDIRSQARKMIGSVVFNARTDQGNTVQMRNLVIGYSSQ